MEAKAKGYDWIGSSFEATDELLRFWIKNGFIPVHLSPTRNPTSREYSAIVIKPLTEKAKSLIELIAEDFKARFIGFPPRHVLLLRRKDCESPAFGSCRVGER